MTNGGGGSGVRVRATGCCRVHGVHAAYRHPLPSLRFFPMEAGHTWKDGRHGYLVCTLENDMPGRMRRCASLGADRAILLGGSEHVGDAAERGVCALPVSDRACARWLLSGVHARVIAAC